MPISFQGIRRCYFNHNKKRRVRHSSHIASASTNNTTPHISTSPQQERSRDIQHTWMLLNRVNLPPLLRLVLMIHLKPRIPLPQHPLQPVRIRHRHPLLRDETAHQLRRAHGQRIAPIDLPEVIYFPVEGGYIPHL